MSFELLAPSLPETGSKIGRFTLKSIDVLEEYKSYGLLFEEEVSGCQVYHVYNEDEENLFSFNFKTIPESSNGVAHILEHTVLCGSEKYPVKDPFVMLYKGSMQTFLNAMTYPDKTVYPASSTVKQDLFNLMSVYADAVFFPLLKKDHFRQEGHRLETNEHGEVEIAGVVYNEMKANYSTHDGIASDWSYRSILPDTPYAYDSGGDPREIPGLSYEYFSDFHKRYYHPSNCQIFLYGNIPSEEYLDFLDREVFSRFDPGDLSKRYNFEVPLQKSWDKPRSMEVPYPAADGSGEGTSVNISWVLPQSKERKLSLAFELISDVLMGNPASPIQKLINESELGEDLSSVSGYENELRQLLFSIGMRGTTPDKARDVEDLIMNGLKDVVEKGIHPDLLEGSLRRFEFRSREIKGGGPFGLRLLSRSMRSWLHGERPRHSLEFEPVLEEVKAELEKNPSWLLDLIREHLIDNLHRCRLTVFPDAELNSREEVLERGTVEDKLTSLGDGAVDRVKAWSESFAGFQKTPDSPEDMARLPFLSVDDIPDDIRRIPNSRQDLEDGTPFYYHEVFTNGISYTDLGFDISALPPEYQLFVPFLTQILPQLGTADTSYEEMMLEWGLKTGGFSVYTENSETLDGRGLQFCYLRLKTLDDMSSGGIDMVRRITTEADFSDHRYLWELFNEYRNDLRSGIVPSGTAYASTRASRGLNQKAYIDDLWRGVAQLRFVEELYDKAGRGAEGSGEVKKEMLSFIAARLEELSAWIFDRRALIMNITAESARIQPLRSELQNYAAALTGKSGGSSEAAPSRGRDGVLEPGFIRERIASMADLLKMEDAVYEGIGYSSKVNFTAMALPGAHLSTREQVAEGLLAHILRTGPLWEKIRMEGGAYGAFAMPDGLARLFVFGSYRDPAIEKSWEAYRESLEIIAGGGLDRQTLDLAKIAVAGKELKPLSPAEQGIISFKREKYGISDDLRSQRRRWLIECTLEDIASAARRLLEGLDKARYAVLADPSAVAELAGRIPGLLRTDLK